MGWFRNLLAILIGKNKRQQFTSEDVDVMRRLQKSIPHSRIPSETESKRTKPADSSGTGLTKPIALTFLEQAREEQKRKAEIQKQIFQKGKEKWPK